MSAVNGSASSGLRLVTRDGEVLGGRWWEAARSEGAAVVLVHGFTGSKDEPSVVATAEAISAAGHDVLAYDARGHRGSSGQCTLGDLERLDVAAAVDAARDRADRIVLVGASMGAIAVLRHAADEPHLAGVVSVSSPSRWRLPRTGRTVLATALTRTSVGRRVAARYMDVRLAPRWTNPEAPEALAARITVPLAIVHGTEDRFVLPREAEELALAAGGRCRLHMVPKMGHAFDRVATPAVLSAIEWVLASEPSPAR